MAKVKQDIHQDVGASLSAAGLDGKGRFRSPGHALATVADVLAKHGLELASTHSLDDSAESTSTVVPIAWTNPHERLAPKEIEGAAIHLSTHNFKDGRHEGLAYVTGPLHKPDDSEHLNFKHAWSTVTPRGNIHKTHADHGEAEAYAAKHNAKRANQHMPLVVLGTQAALSNIHRKRESAKPVADPSLKALKESLNRVAR